MFVQISDIFYNFYLVRLINDGVFINQQETDYISLTNDLLFHMVFTRNLDALKGLLAVMLNLPELSIKEISRFILPGDMDVVVVATDVGYVLLLE